MTMTTEITMTVLATHRPVGAYLHKLSQIFIFVLQVKVRVLPFSDSAAGPHNDVEEGVEKNQTVFLERTVRQQYRNRFLTKKGNS